MKTKSQLSTLEGGSYHVVLYLPKLIRIRIGKLGVHNFQKGYYVYTGSAMKNIMHRVERHIRKKKNVRWHIDYLTTHPIVSFISTHIYFSSENLECFRNQIISGLSGAKFPVHGFGSSDCVNKCSSHLIYFSSLPNIL